MKYRAEIDGLRALAVLPVIFFHAGFEWLSGGFVGVDVFFVISGYLITTLIINEMDQGKFSIVNFYERRARRILPALFFVMLVCLPFAWFWLAPLSLKDFGQSLVAVATFSSNILFLLESGYFEMGAEFKPLLHTWSLAVEEQYYILFPIFLLFTWRLGLKWILSILVIAFVFSLGLAHWIVNDVPATTFYLIVTRGWELLIGVFAAFYLKHKGYFKSDKLNQTLSFLGLGFIVYAIIAFDDTTPFPSLYALIPTVGTALLILAAVPKTWIHKLLSYPFIVGVGLISYSAYLWHQPILAFARHRLLGEIPDVVLIVLCLSSLVLAYASWRWVEKPFRDKNRISRGHIFGYSFIGIISFVFLGLVIHATDGLRTAKINYEFTENESKIYKIIEKSINYRVPDRVPVGECNIWVQNPNQFDRALLNSCFDKYGNPVIILGDSHAINIYSVFSKSNEYPYLIGVAQGRCRAHDDRPYCHYSDFVDFLSSNLPMDPQIIYHQSGSYFLKGSRGRHEPSLDDKNLSFDSDNVNLVIDYLGILNNLDARVYWLGPYTEYRIELNIGVNRIYDVPEKNFEIFEQLERDIKNTVKARGLSFYIPFSQFYTVERETLKEGCLIWQDGDHFSACGEDYVASKANFDIFEK